MKTNSTIKIKSSVKPMEGILKISKYFPNGDTELVLHEKNIITLLVKQNILSGIYSTMVSDAVVSLQLGTGGTIDPAGQFPKSVNQGLTSLFTPLLLLTTSYVVNNGVPSVTFIADADTSTGNGSLITEAGLKTASGNLFNIKTFPGVPKTSEFGLHFEWTIQLS